MPGVEHFFLAFGCKASTQFRLTLRFMRLEPGQGISRGDSEGTEGQTFRRLILLRARPSSSPAHTGMSDQAWTLCCLRKSYGAHVKVAFELRPVLISPSILPMLSSFAGPVAL